MQKRQLKFKSPNSELRLVYVPVKLNREFPFSEPGSQKLYTLDSTPLTHLHHHDVLEIGYCYEGSGIFVVDNKIMPFCKGDASVVFRNEIHIAKSSPESLSSWCFIYLDPALLLNEIGFRDLPQLFACLDGSIDFMNVIIGKDEADLVTVIREIIEELRRQNNLYKDAVKGLTLCFLARLSRTIMKYNPDGILNVGHNDIVRISPALNSIFRNHNRQIHIPELAALCGMCPTNFRRIFSKVMKLSPLEFINHFRIRMASAMLSNTDATVLDISLNVGYESLSSFNRHFKKITGVAPREWRKQ